MGDLLATIFVYLLFAMILCSPVFLFTDSVFYYTLMVISAFSALLGGND